MITKQTIRSVHSLQLKKFRDETRSFVAESPKVVSDLLALMPCRRLFATEEFLAAHSKSSWKRVDDLQVVSHSELERLSKQKSPRGAVAVFEKPEPSEDDAGSLSHIAGGELCLALDDVQDPGNLGTIVRVADWFGIAHIFASPHTADVFSPKVVQSTMGAVGRVSLHYVPLPALLRVTRGQAPVFGTFLDGEDIFRASLPAVSRGVIVMGNEGAGISPDVEETVTRRLLVPNYPLGRQASESLNVAVATAVVCAEFRRRSAVACPPASY